MSGSHPASKDGSILDRTVHKMLEKLTAESGPPVYSLSPTEARNTLLRLQSAPVGKPEEVQVKDWNVHSGQHSLRLRTIRPNAVSDRSPVVMYFHGAG